MKFFKYLLLFLIINFGSLYLGILLMNNGPLSTWYTTLNQAPWTPPNWVFGTAWTIIMICFSWYLACLFKQRQSFSLWLFFIFQVVLNISWNYIFFNKHWVAFGLLVIILLFSDVLYFFIRFRLSALERIRYLLLPYLAWLCIAISLNMYILIHN